MNWANAKVFDFTNSVDQGSDGSGAGDASRYEEFAEGVVDVLRQPTKDKLAIILDYGYGFKNDAPYLVLDHINLSGSNPLTGPNHTCGERFPVVNSVYITDFKAPLLPGIQTGVAAGLKNGLKPTEEELAFLYSIGASFYCYHLIPTMLIAAHAGWKVVAIVAPHADKGVPTNWANEALHNVMNADFAGVTTN